MTALREIKLLREIDNPYIVRLLDVFPHKRNLSLVCRSPSILSKAPWHVVLANMPLRCKPRLLSAVRQLIATIRPILHWDGVSMI